MNCLSTSTYLPIQVMNIFVNIFFNERLFAAEKDYLKMIGMLSRSILHTGQVSYTIFLQKFLYYK